jgi:hypothetical protein
MGVEAEVRQQAPLGACEEELLSAFPNWGPQE